MESTNQKQERAQLIFQALSQEYPDAHCALNHRNAFELLCATILSAQCTDERVNMVTPELFRAYPSARELSKADQHTVESIIHSTGFFRNKAKNLIAMAQQLCLDHQGEVPPDLEKLTNLPGVGRKTANVVLGNIFGIPGMVVDTHVGRLSALLGLTDHTDPLKVEQDLMGLFPAQRWNMLSHLLISHGRAVCIARRPKCAYCLLAGDCPSAHT